jgi:hypothetical protein
MTFLKKLGQILAQGIAMFAGIYPLVAPLFGSNASKVSSVGATVVNDLTNIAQVVVTAEAMYQTPGSGALKVGAAGPLVYNILKTSEAFAGHKVADEAKALAASIAMASAVADFMNALKPDNLQTQGKELPLSPVPSGAQA